MWSWSLWGEAFNPYCMPIEFMSLNVTVDGRNPAPVDRYFIPLFTRFSYIPEFLPSTVVLNVNDIWSSTSTPVQLCKSKGPESAWGRSYKMWPNHLCGSTFLGMICLQQQQQQQRCLNTSEEKMREHNKKGVGLSMLQVTRNQTKSEHSKMQHLEFRSSCHTYDHFIKHFLTHQPGWFHPSCLTFGMAKITRFETSRLPSFTSNPPQRCEAFECHGFCFWAFRIFRFEVFWSSIVLFGYSILGKNCT